MRDFESVCRSMEDISPTFLKYEISVVRVKSYINPPELREKDWEGLRDVLYKHFFSDTLNEELGQIFLKLMSLLTNETEEVLEKRLNRR